MNAYDKLGLNNLSEARIHKTLANFENKWERKVANRLENDDHASRY